MIYKLLLSNGCLRFQDVESDRFIWGSASSRSMISKAQQKVICKYEQMLPYAP